MPRLASMSRQIGQKQDLLQGRGAAEQILRFSSQPCYKQPASLPILPEKLGSATQSLAHGGRPLKRLCASDRPLTRAGCTTAS